LPSRPSIRSALNEVDEFANRESCPKQLKKQFAEWAKLHPIGDQWVPYPPSFWENAVVLTIKAGETLLLPSGWVNYKYTSIEI
jgi:hypothetical protein